MKLENKVAIITGGGSGIGKETALLFAKEGAKVVIADINEKNGEEVAETIRKNGKDATFIKVNVSNTEEVKAMVARTITIYGRIDILINNGGIVRDEFLTKTTDENIELVIGVNLIGPIKCAREVAAYMIEHQIKGTIINTSSVVRKGNKGQTVYSATKAAIEGLTKTWAKELGPKGIRVNAVAPGFITTPMTAGVPEKILDVMKAKTPLGVLGDPIDIANAYLFLASDDAKYANGTILDIDGGLVT